MFVTKLSFLAEERFGQTLKNRPSPKARAVEITDRRKIRQPEAEKVGPKTFRYLEAKIPCHRNQDMRPSPKFLSACRRGPPEEFAYLPGDNSPP
jgi:hypothetical protein